MSDTSLRVLSSCHRLKRFYAPRLNDPTSRGRRTVGRKHHGLGVGLRARETQIGHAYLDLGRCRRACSIQDVCIEGVVGDSP
jgi:hypothetical protein